MLRHLNQPVTASQIREYGKQLRTRLADDTGSIGFGFGGPNTTVETAPSGRRWRAGDPIDQLTAAGRTPTWWTSQSRYWKNRVNGALDGEFSVDNLARMKRGRAPLHDELGVPMELHHLDPQRLGGANVPEHLVEVWPWEHAAIDPFRHYRGPTP